MKCRQVAEYGGERHPDHREGERSAGVFQGVEGREIESALRGSEQPYAGARQNSPHENRIVMGKSSPLINSPRDEVAERDEGYNGWDYEERDSSEAREKSAADMSGKLAVSAHGASPLR